MILGIMGTPGAFKTAYVVQERIVKFLRDGREIFTNVKGLKPYYIATLFDLDPFEVEKHIHYLGRVYRNDEEDSFFEDPDRIRNFNKEVPPGSVVIIDEAQDYFGCRDFKSDYSRDLIPWLSKCRHENYDVIWVTPNFDNVDITFRRTSHLFYKIVRLEHLGFKKTSRIYMWPTMDTTLKPLASKLFSPKEITFECYDSYDVKDVKENRESHNVLLRSPFVWFMIVCLCWAGYVLLSGSFERTIMKKDVKKKETVIETKSEVISESGEEQNENKDSVCVSKSIKIRGKTEYIFSDGSSSFDSYGRTPCGP